jgi:hypothetical protein
LFLMKFEIRSSKRYFRSIFDRPAINQQQHNPLSFE